MLVAAPGVSGAEVARVAPGHYILFVDDAVVDVPELIEARREMPQDVFIEIIPLKLRHGKAIEEAVSLYKVNNAD